MSAAEILIDGLPPSTDDLTHQALVNYGALTSFRVEDAAARGLDLHLARLRRSAEELFGEAPDEDELRRLMQLAVQGRGDCWLRVSLFSPEIGHRTPSWEGRPTVMTAVFPPPPPLAESVRLTAMTHERETPHLKHVATMSLIQARRRARATGFDDALFLTRSRHVSEGSLWNVGFIKDGGVVWPEAPMLAGVTQAVLQAQLETGGVTQETRPVAHEELSRFDGAFICNSATPVCPVVAIDERIFAVDETMIRTLQAAWDCAPVHPI